MLLTRFDPSSFSLAAWLCLLASVFLAVRRPAANALLSLTLVGIGTAPLVGDVSAARLSAVVAVASLVSLLRPSGRRRSRVALQSLARSPLLWFTGLCLLVLLKILIETVVYGLDSARAASLEVGLAQCVFPLSVVLLALARDGREATARDLLTGMIVFPVLMVAGYLPFAIEEGLMQATWFGTERFQFGPADPINTARVLTYGVLALLMWLSARRRYSLPLQVGIAALASAMLVLLLLTGTRQFVLAVAWIPVVWTWSGTRVTLLRRAGQALVILGLLGTAFWVVSERSLVFGERVSTTALSTEMATGRGVVWTEALQALLEHPVLGAGFKNFGEDKFVGVGRFGADVVVRTSAHGVLQDVFTEHGLLLGILFVVGVVQLLARIWMHLREERAFTAERAVTILLLMLLTPLLFSGTFLNATPLFLLLVFVMAKDGAVPAECAPRGVAARWLVGRGPGAGRLTRWR